MYIQGNNKIAMHSKIKWAPERDIYLIASNVTYFSQLVNYAVSMYTFKARENMNIYLTKENATIKWTKYTP
jgi:hypothetical protein